ncbi:allophanate hydrolase subunit 1, putative [Roseobacter denitrificans OCh 114]|uniref:Allophanate hydrolase subunit 1, putative n=2 Tax=Roseobacter denitrificans TaxID=2434 RepID=Q16DH3_ROSDO|nr:allophanate hydrolase subunit 1, putative [Roseobacter denitrificans OCh 114]
MSYPQIKTVGLSGLLVTFAEKMSSPANRAALAFRAAVVAADWPEVRETSMSLVSVYVVADLVSEDIPKLITKLENLLSQTDWYAAPLPEGRRLWHVPTVYGTDLAPQLEEAAELAGVDPDTAIQQLSTTRMRVLTIGFAPGQPYMGELGENWNIPRQQDLTKSVPAGALVAAIRQLVVFTAPTPTGWRHVGQTAFENFRQTADQPFALTPGDELLFPQVSRQALMDIMKSDTSGNGGAERETLP